MQNPCSRRFALMLAAFAALAAATPVHAQEAKIGALTITNAWSRATPPGAKIGVGYLTIENGGKDADRLVSVTSPAADKVEIHKMSMNKGVMVMRPVAGGVAIASGKTVTLAPDGLHMMFVGLKAPLKQGSKLTATLAFEKAGKVEVTFPIAAMGATKPMSSSMPMPMHH